MNVGRFETNLSSQIKEMHIEEYCVRYVGVTCDLLTIDQHFIRTGLIPSIKKKSSAEMGEYIDFQRISLKITTKH